MCCQCNQHIMSRKWSPQSGIVRWQHSSCKLPAAVGAAAQCEAALLESGSRHRHQTSGHHGRWRLNSQKCRIQERGSQHLAAATEQWHQAPGRLRRWLQCRAAPWGRGDRQQIGATHGGPTLSRSRASSLIASRMWLDSKSSFLTRMACHTSEQEGGMGTSTQWALSIVAW